MSSWQSLPWIFGPIAFPLLGGLLAFVLQRRALPWLPVVTLTGVGSSLVGLSFQVLPAEPLRYTVGGWGAPLGIDLYADGLALLMLWLTTWAGSLVSLYALGYFREQPEKAELFWPLWLLLWTALNALYLSADLFNLYVTLELTTLAGVALVALAGSGVAVKAALHYLLFAIVGSLAYLLGVALLYGDFGTLDIFLLAQAVTPAAPLAVAATLITAGLLVKTAVFPLHVWLPPAHAGAPTPVSALLSALVVKGSFYLLIRLWFDAWPALLTPAAGQLLGALGASAILYGSLQALRQPRLKLLVAYSTVAQLGYLLLLFPLGGTLAWSGAIYHALSHGLAKSALFMAVGNVLVIVGHDRIKDLRGIDWGLPLTLFAIALAGVTVMGLPPSGGFVAKWLLLKAALDGGQWWWAVVMLIGGLLAAGYVFRVLRYAFAHTEPGPRTESSLPWSMKWIPFLLALSALGLGFAGQPVLNVLGVGAPGATVFKLLSWSNPLPLLALLTSFGAGVVIFLLNEQRHRLRVWLNLAAALLNLALVSVILVGVYLDTRYEVRLATLPGLDLVLRADAFAMLFVTLSAVLWLLTTVYAIGYLEDSPHRSRFFGFFSFCVGSTMGVAMAGNLITFFIFYELLTLSTYPLVVHRGTEQALRAGAIYLRYTLVGGAVLLLGILWLYSLTGSQDFVEGGVLGQSEVRDYASLQMIFVLLIGGFAVKAALVPLHGWLPRAMVAPAPVSALLHAVAVVKAGAFGIVRVIYDVYGASFAHQQLGVTVGLMVLAAFTILYGSLQALRQDDLKRRLAFSTVSQVSYIALGVAIAGPIATIGGIVHLVHQGLMKITLFFCAGNFAETLGIHKVSEMNGVGRRMPWTTGAFTLGAFGMIGVPPMAGFISKWYLGLGSLGAAQPWVILVLVASTLLNAAYFLPVLYRAWFLPAPSVWPHEVPRGHFETGLMLLLPALITAGLSLAAGLLAGTDVSPLSWATLIAEREYR